MMPKRRIKKNDLTAWFLEDHAQLPASYVKSCQKFFEAGREDAEMYKFKEISDELQATSDKPQAASHKPVDKLINKG